jgi:DNA repair protein RadA/Sms
MHSEKGPPAPPPALESFSPEVTTQAPIRHQEIPARSRLRLVRAPSPDLSIEELNEELDIDDDDGPMAITDIEEKTFDRTSTGIPPLDDVLGGGLVEGSVILLASPPGIGKSTLALQMLAGLGHRCLYVTGEETREQIAGTARRIGAVTPRLFVMREHNIETICARARKLRAQTIVIDSIQKMECPDVTGRANTPGQLKECTARLVTFAKDNGTMVWIIGHITGDGDIAGPKTVEHDVDVVLEMSQGAAFDGNERILRCPGKNRFGATGKTGRLELTEKGLVPIDGDGWNEPL